MSSVQKRRRSKVACETCRAFKRKCDSHQPCGPCVRYEYDCTYQETAARGKKKPRPAPVPPPPAYTPASYNSPSMIVSDSEPSLSSAHNHLRSLEANSGAAFARKLALKIDPKNAPRMHLFAWNSFLGARDDVNSPGSQLQRPQPITGLLSQADMQSLTSVYFDKVDPIYGFVDRQELEWQIGNRWMNPELNGPYDGVLCGVAALGCLYSHVKPGSVERSLVQSARSILEESLSDTPTMASITAWALRVTYLRITGTPHMAWMASCVLMHMVEAGGLHCEPSKDTVLPLARDDIDPEVRRRLFGVAKHLNTWMSFDIGRSRVVLHNATTIVPSPRPGDYTAELMELLPYVEILDPGRAPEPAELETALDVILRRTHTVPPSILARCNLVLCLCRRLKSLNAAFTAPLLEQILSVTLEGIQAARSLLEQRAPWHHMANIPFQVVCILLAIDTYASISQLREAMDCLSNVAAVYKTEATQEALGTASLLILLHQKRKERCASRLKEILEQYPVPDGENAKGSSSAPQLEDLGWLSGLAAEIPSLQDIDFDQFLNPDLYWDVGNQNH